MKNLVQIIISVIGLILKGFVLQKLWIWFIVPTFNLPMLSLPIAIGICLTISMITYQFSSSDAKNANDVALSWTSTICSIIIPLFFLLEGYIVTLFM